MISTHKSLIGAFLYEQSAGIIDSIEFSTLNNYYEPDKTLKTLQKKHNIIAKPHTSKLSKTLKASKAPKASKLSKAPKTSKLSNASKESYDSKISNESNFRHNLKNKTYFPAFRNQNILLTKQQIKESVNNDDLIVQTVSNMSELDITANTLSKRLREWFSLILPELDKGIPDHEKFADLVATKNKKDLLKELGIEKNESMGANLEKVDVEEMKLLATQILGLYNLRDTHELYLEKIMKDYCPNFHAIAGTNIGAKLFEHGKSLKRLACLPASTIQLLGAEKALFRHIKTGSKSPKYGIIYTHYLVQKAKRKDKGMVARAVANKLSIALRIDFFHGKFQGDEMREKLEKKFGFKKS
jgi:nucleolar protein 56